MDYPAGTPHNGHSPSSEVGSPPGQQPAPVALATMKPEEAPIYRYSALGGQSIRLIRLLPHRDKTALIQCEIFACPLLDGSDDAVGGLYEALSYVWGSPANPRVISIADRDPSGDSAPSNSGQLSITGNLHEALTRLRHPHVDRILWIDAVCINQGDVDERNHQVTLMALVYAGASRVLVWLGEDNGDASESALTELGHIARGHKCKRNLTPAMEALCRRPWFRRAWVLQEVAAAHRIIVMCGSAALDGHAFYLAVMALLKKVANVNKDYADDDKDDDDKDDDDKDDDDNDGAAAPRMTWVERYELASASATHTKEELTSIHSAALLMKETFNRGQLRSHRTGNATKSRFTLELAPLADLMDAFLTREATDCRDKVFALLGLANDDLDRSELAPDYGASFEALVRRLCDHLFEDRVTVTAAVDTPDQRLIFLRVRGRLLGTGDFSSREGALTVCGKALTESRTRAHFNAQNPFLDLNRRRYDSTRGDSVVVAFERVGKPSTYMVLRTHDDYFTVGAITNLVQWRKDVPEFEDHTREFWVLWDWNGKSPSSDDWETSAAVYLPAYQPNVQERVLRYAEAGLAKWAVGWLQDGEALVLRAIQEQRTVLGRENDSDITILDWILRDCQEKDDMLRLWRLRNLSQRISAAPKERLSDPDVYEAAYSQHNFPGLDVFLSAEDGQAVPITKELMQVVSDHRDYHIKNTWSLILKTAIFKTPKAFLQPDAILAIDWMNLDLVKRAVEAGLIRFDDPATLEIVLSDGGANTAERFTLLWDKHCDHWLITPRLFLLAVRNGNTSLEVLDFLLQKYQDQGLGHPGDLLTPSAFAAAARHIHLSESGRLHFRHMYAKLKSFGLPVTAAFDMSVFGSADSNIVELLIKLDGEDKLGIFTPGFVRKLLRELPDRSFDLLYTIAERGEIDLVMSDWMLEESVSGIITGRLVGKDKGVQDVEYVLIQTLLWEDKRLQLDTYKVGKLIAGRPARGSATKADGAKPTVSGEQADKASCSIAVDRWMMETMKTIARCRGLHIAKEILDVATQTSKSGCSWIYPELLKELGTGN